MLSGLRVAHRLLLIYLLSFASVAYLAYTLVAEKNIAIEFARKELRGIGYVDVVRQSLVSIIRAGGGCTEAGITAATIRTADQIAALASAEREYDITRIPSPRRCSSAAMRHLVAQGTGDPAARRLLEARAIDSARLLISRIGDESNLILDPDLDSYYTMSVVMLRLPEAVTEATDLAEEAVTVNLSKPAAVESRMKFLLKEGVFSATIDGLMSDIAAAFRGNADGKLRTNLEPSFLRARSAINDFSRTCAYGRGAPLRRQQLGCRKRHAAPGARRRG